MPKLFLTDNFIRHANCPTEKQQELYWDHPRSIDGIIRSGSISGLGVRVTNAGIKTFIHSYRYRGKRKRISLGNPANMNVAAARLLVSHREQSILNGDNPDQSAEDKLGFDSPTITEIIDKYWDAKAEHWSSEYRNDVARRLSHRYKHVPKLKTCRGQNTRKLNVDFESAFKDQTPESIKPDAIMKHLKQYTNADAYNTALARIKSFFNWAIRMQLIDMRNPCDPLDRIKIYKDRRDYSPQQMKAIHQHVFFPNFSKSIEVLGVGEAKRLSALQAGRKTQSDRQMLEYCRYLGILFLTMARPSDVKRAKFEHFDLENLIWNKHNTKGIQLSRQTYEFSYRSVPIHKKVAELVTEQRKRWPDAEYVFPSSKDSSKHRDDFSRQHQQFKELEGVPDYFQVYDIKRMMISILLVGQGIPREDISHYVDHKGNLEMTMLYATNRVDPLRPVSEKVGEILGFKS